MYPYEENKDSDICKPVTAAGDEEVGLAVEMAAELISNKGFEPIIPSDAPAVLSWKELVVSTKVSKSKVQKQLLNNLSGCITGGLWAIMGSSGSGKTTFLSALALRLDKFRMNVTGDIRLNGEAYSKYQLKSMSGYVMQDDLIHSHLTVVETLSYTAELRMPSTSTAAERKDREEYVMKLMGICKFFCVCSLPISATYGCMNCLFT
jgi:ABC-type molybdenum transport system ATPase subunit/photorepair protein PhrA